MNDPAVPERWLLLIHHLPAKPAYLRVKVSRRLQALGAIAVKNAVYVVPARPALRTGLEAIVRELGQEGGGAVICEAGFVVGLTDGEIRASFDAARDADYETLVRDARRLLDAAEVSQAELKKLRRRRDEIAALDYFGAPGRQTIDNVIAALDERTRRHPDVSRPDPRPEFKPADLKARTWVTRRNVHIDRIASAWLIRRFIDRRAVFRFVDGKDYKPRPKELRFDMANAEFTHEADRCTFETLMHRAGLESDAALRAIAEIVHELDIDDGKYKRAETAGFRAMINGACAAAARDERRLALGAVGLDQFYAHFQRS